MKKQLQPIIKQKQEKHRDRLKEISERTIFFSQSGMRSLCSAATYYLLKGVCDETDRFNSHHVVSHAYNYPFDVRAGNSVLFVRCFYSSFNFFSILIALWLTILLCLH